MSKKKIAILSNVTVDLIKQKLKKEYEIYVPQGFDTWIQEIINFESNLYKEEMDAIIVLIDGTEARSWKSAEEAVERISLWKQAVTLLSNQEKGIPVFISTIDIRENRVKALAERKYAIEWENDWYQCIQQLSERTNNIYVIDIADCIREIGRIEFYSDKMWYMSNIPYSKEGLTCVVKELRRVLGSAFNARKKLITLDLDNTLWGGVVGEDGVEGIELSDHKEGQRFFDFQKQFLEMQKRGTLLAINSKNNDIDAQNAIKNHPNMLLREEHFVAQKINWDNKASNIKKIAKELNLTESSLIFIDDNPIEREIVRGNCPEVLVPDFPEDTTTLLAYAENIYFEYCRPLRVLNEDIHKTQMYQLDVKRKKELETSLNLDDYIKKLEMCVNMHRMRPDEIDRVTQLCNKTNQFNVTTKRYTKTELQEIANTDGNAIYVAYAKDKFGESGLISVLIIVSDGEDAKIDTFLMSCRVMGRKLENVILSELMEYLKGKYTRLHALYIPTAKNMPVRELYEGLGFTLTFENVKEKRYEKELTEYQKEKYEIYKEISFEE